MEEKITPKTIYVRVNTKEQRELFKMHCFFVWIYKFFLTERG
jgi:hypothetical protein